MWKTTENDFLRIVSYEPADIVATFKDGRSARYTRDVLRMMRGDPDVVTITDAETGATLK